MLKNFIFALSLTSTLFAMDKQSEESKGQSNPQNVIQNNDEAMVPAQIEQQNPFVVSARLTDIPGNLEKLWHQGNTGKYFMVQNCGAHEEGTFGSRGNSCFFLSAKEGLECGEDVSLYSETYIRIREELKNLEGSGLEGLTQSPIFRSIVGDLLITYQSEAEGAIDSITDDVFERNIYLDSFVQGLGITDAFSEARALSIQTTNPKHINEFFNKLVFNLAEDYLKNKENSSIFQYLDIFFGNDFPVSVGGNVNYGENAGAFSLPFPSMIDAVSNLFFTKINVWGQLYKMKPQSEFKQKMQSLLKEEILKQQLMNDQDFRANVMVSLISDQDFANKNEDFILSLYEEGGLEHYLNDPQNGYYNVLLEEALQVDQTSGEKSFSDESMVLFEGEIDKVTSFYDPSKPELFVSRGNAQDLKNSLNKDLYKDISLDRFLTISLDTHTDMYQKNNMLVKTVKPSVMTDSISLFHNGSFHWYNLPEVSPQQAKLIEKKRFSDKVKALYMQEHKDRLFSILFYDPKKELPKEPEKEAKKEGELELIVPEKKEEVAIEEKQIVIEKEEKVSEKKEDNDKDNNEKEIEKK